MSEDWPEPTKAEAETLALHITDWRDRPPVEQGICLAVLRGHNTTAEIAAFLGFDAAAIEAAVPHLIGKGLLWDNRRLLLH